MTERDTPGRGRPDAEASGAKRTKKAYVQPKVIDYGSISKLSASKPGGALDGGNPSMMTCL